MPSFKKVRPSHRPPKLTPELTEKVCSVMRAGAYIETAAIVNGISKEVFYRWCQLANGKLKKQIGGGNERAYTEAEKRPYKAFLHAVEKAMEECTVRDLLNIDKCAMGKPGKFLKDKHGNLILNHHGDPILEELPVRSDWSASAWRLERRHARHWAKLEKTELTGKDGGPVETKDLSTKTEEELKAELERLRNIRRK